MNSNKKLTSLDYEFQIAYCERKLKDNDVPPKLRTAIEQKLRELKTQKYKTIISEVYYGDGTNSTYNLQRRLDIVQDCINNSGRDGIEAQDILNLMHVQLALELELNEKLNNWHK